MAEPGLNVIMDEEDGLESMDLLRRLDAALPEGRAVVRVTPGGSALYSLARDVLTGLGKRISHTGNGRRAHEAWLRVHCWLRAEGIRQLYVSRAHLLGEVPLRQMVALATACGADLFLIFQASDLTRAQRSALEDFPHTRIDFQEFCSAHAAAKRPESSGAFSFPEVPRDDFPLFLASCREVLTDEEFALVHARAAEGFGNATRALRRQADAPVLLDVARKMADESGCLNEALAGLRGIQVAALQAKLLLKVDLLRFGAEWAAVTKAVSPDETARRLRWLVDPRRAAIAALCAAGSIAPNEITSLRMEDVTRKTVRVGDRCELQLPDALRPIIEAQRLARIAEGGMPDEPFLTMRGPTHRKQVAWSVRGVQYALRTLSRETGLIFRSGALTPKHASDAEWARLAGLRVMGI